MLVPVVIQIVDMPPEVRGQFVKLFDFDAHNGQGHGVFTDDPREAKKFQTTHEAMLFWRTRSRARPTRPDGKPNRPFTASSVNIAPLTDFL
jgi:hypothetical protein